MLYDKFKEMTCDLAKVGLKGLMAELRIWQSITKKHPPKIKDSYIRRSAKLDGSMNVATGHAWREYEIL